MFISPMLLEKSDAPFDSDQFITELKLDGIRLLYTKDKEGRVRLYTRHHNDVTSKFPELLDIPLPPGTVLDGEIIVTDENGKPDFESMMSRFQSSRSHYNVSYVVFDILMLNDIPLNNLPLLERKRFLNTEVLPEDTKLVAKSQ